MSLRIQFTSPGVWFKPFAWLVQLFERTPYSHVRFLMEIAPSYHVVFEASGTSVKFLGENALASHPVKIHAEYEIPANFSEIVTALMPYAGVRYGAFQIIGIALARVFRLKKNPFGDGKRTLVCSELVALILESVYHIDIPDDLDVIGPRDLKDFMDRHPLIFRKIVSAKAS